MKLKKKSFYNLFNTRLIKVQSYKGLRKAAFFFLNAKYISGFRNLYTIFELNYTKLFIKKSLKIFFRFLKLKKAICFVGFNKNFNKTFLSENFFFEPSLSTLKNNYIRPDLVLFNTSYLKANYLNKMDTTVPTIAFFSNNSEQKMFSYKILGNFKSPVSQVYFFYLLKAIATVNIYYDITCL